MSILRTEEICLKFQGRKKKKKKKERKKEFKDCHRSKNVQTLWPKLSWIRLWITEVQEIKAIATRRGKPETAHR